MRRLVAIFTLVLLSVEARANDPDADVRSVIDRGLTFLAKDNLNWKESKKCFGFLDAASTSAGKPTVFAVDVEEDNYDVTIRFGEAAGATSTTIQVESRRLMAERVSPGHKLSTLTFRISRRVGLASRFSQVEHSRPWPARSEGSGVRISEIAANDFSTSRAADGDF